VNHRIFERILHFGVALEVCLTEYRFHLISLACVYARVWGSTLKHTHLCVCFLRGFHHARAALSGRKLRVAVGWCRPPVFLSFGKTTGSSVSLNSFNGIPFTNPNKSFSCVKKQKKPQHTKKQKTHEIQTFGKEATTGSIDEWESARQQRSTKNQSGQAVRLVNRLIKCLKPLCGCVSSFGLVALCLWVPC